jgi:hypothetical protein
MDIDIPSVGPQDDWWNAAQPTAKFVGGGIEINVTLVSDDDCPPNAGDGECESFPVRGVLSVRRITDETTIRVSGRCGC